VGACFLYRFFKETGGPYFFGGLGVVTCICLGVFCGFSRVFGFSPENHWKNHKKMGLKLEIFQ